MGEDRGGHISLINLLYWISSETDFFMKAKGCVKEDGAFKFYEQESSRRGMSYHARRTTHDPLPTHPRQLVNLLFRPYLKTFVPPFLPTRLTAPGSPKMNQAEWIEHNSCSGFEKQNSSRLTKRHVQKFTCSIEITCQVFQHLYTCHCLLFCSWMIRTFQPRSFWKIQKSQN